MQEDAASRGDVFDPTKINFVVPTGNFGNALAGFYAREMGLPINRLVVATNQNDILYRFIQHGDYSARPVHPSLAPAMDIVVPSNFERFLFWFFDNDAKTLASAMKSIKEKGTMKLGAREAECMERLGQIFVAAHCSDAEIKTTTAQFRQSRNYLVCPHTATGLHAATQHMTADSSPTHGFSSIAFATAHPGKFGDGLTESKKCPPALPPQLDGLLEKETRCRSIPHKLSALRGVMDDDREARDDRTAAELRLADQTDGSGAVVKAMLVTLAGAFVLRWLTNRK